MLVIYSFKQSNKAPIAAKTDDLECVTPQNYDTHLDFEELL